MHCNRFSTMTSNKFEPVNSVIKLFKQCPIDYLFELLRHMLQEWFYKNQSIACGIFMRVAVKQENILRLNTKLPMGLRVNELSLDNNHK